MPGVLPLFPTTLLVSDPYVLSDNERHVLTEQAWRANRSGNATSVDTYILRAPALQPLRSFIEAQVEYYARTLLGLTDELDLYLTQSWVNKNAGGTRHHPHSHPNSVLSGVFFIQGDACPLVFHRNTPLFGGFSFPSDPVNQFNAERWSVQNEPGVAVLFPSTLRHEVVENPSEQPRYSLSFNSFVKGTLGRRRKLTELVL